MIMGMALFAEWAIFGTTAALVVATFVVLVGSLVTS
jgi:hypothetical protein